MRAKYVDVDGIRTRVLYEGRGHAVFLLHGVGLTADTFIRNIDALAEHFIVYAPDLPGHGFTEAVDYGHEKPQRVIARHVNALADRLELTSYSALGSSFGALIAGLMWFERPECVKNLVLVGSGSAFHPPEEQERVLRAASANFSKAINDLTLAGCRARLAAICFDPSSVADEILPAQLTAYAQPGIFEAYAATINGVVDSLSCPDSRILTRLEQITAPTLILTGREDPRADWKLHVEACGRMPNADLVIFEKCGHMPYMEHARLFNETVRDFLLSRHGVTTSKPDFSTVRL